MAVAATSPVLTRLDPRRCEVALELIDDHLPLLLVRWAGQIQPQHVLHMIRFFDINGEVAATQGHRLVHICDARDAEVPSSLVRDMFVDWLGDRPRPGEERSLRTFVVATDPLIKGVVASLKWATGRSDGIVVVSTLEQAVAQAREALELANMRVPEILLSAA